MNKHLKDIEYYRNNPIEWLEDMFPNIKFFDYQKKIFEKYCKEIKKVKSDKDAQFYMASARGNPKYGLEKTLAVMLNSSTPDGKGSKEVEINGCKCNIQ